VNVDSTAVYLTLAVIGTNDAGNKALRPYSRYREFNPPWGARAAGSVAKGRSPNKLDDSHRDIARRDMVGRQAPIKVGRAPNRLLTQTQLFVLLSRSGAFQYANLLCNYSLALIHSGSLQRRGALIPKGSQSSEGRH